MREFSGIMNVSNMQAIRTLVLAIFLTLLGNGGVHAQYHTQKHRAFPPEFQYAQPPPNQYSPYPQQQPQQFYGIPPVIPPNYPFPTPTQYPAQYPAQYPNIERPQQDLSAKSPMIVPPHTFLGRIPGFLALYYEQPDVYHNVTVHSRMVNGTDALDRDDGEDDVDGDDYDDVDEGDDEDDEDESSDENERSDFNIECEKAPDGKGGDGFDFSCRYAKKGQNISTASKTTSAAAPKKTTPKPTPKSTPKAVTKSTPKPKPKPKPAAKSAPKAVSVQKKAGKASGPAKKPANKSKKAPAKKETKKTGGKRKKNVKKKVSKRIEADLPIEDLDEELQNRLEKSIPADQPADSPSNSVDAEGRHVVQFLTENVWSDFYHVDSKNVSGEGVDVPELRASTLERSRIFLKCDRFNASSLSDSEKRPTIKLDGIDYACAYADKTDLKEAIVREEAVEK